MEGGAADRKCSGAPVRACSPGSQHRFALVEESPNTERVSDSLSPNMEGAPSKRLAVAGWLTRPGWHNTILMDHAVVAKQTLKNHSEQIGKSERTMRAIYELILDSHPEVPSPQV